MTDTELVAPEDGGGKLIGAAAYPPWGCNYQVQLTEEGNTDYAWYFLTNHCDKAQATVSIERSWIYQGELKKETRQHVLYAKERREVFNFPRNQDPQCGIIACNLG